MHLPTPTSPDTGDWEDGFVESNGVDLHYYRTGNPDGSSLVLAHGLYDDGRCFAPTAAEFADRFDVVAIDARGHGLSDAPDSGYEVGDRVSDLAGLLDALNIDAPILWGHSMGGNSVASLAASKPNLPRALVLEDPAGMLPGVHERVVDEHVREVRAMIDSWQAQSDEVLRDSFEHEAWVEYLLHARRHVKQSVTALFHDGYSRPSETFPQISCPTLVLRADVDCTQRAHDRERVNFLDDGRVEHVSNAGHCIRRDEFGTTVQLVRQFLAVSVGTE